MPANFPTTEQKRYYGRFVEAPTPEQLGSYFHLADADRSLIYSRTKEHTQLGLTIFKAGIVALSDYFGVVVQPTQVNCHLSKPAEGKLSCWRFKTPATLADSLLSDEFSGKT